MLWATIPIGLLVTGTFGNILNIVVLSRRRMRQYPTTVYLLCLSFGDCTFLWLGMGSRMLLQGYDIDVKAVSPFLCKVIIWLPVTCAGYSVWIIVLMTFERVLLTRWPVSAKVKLTRRNTVKIVVVLFAMCVSLTCHFLYVSKLVVNENTDGSNMNKYRCTYTDGPNVEFYTKRWPFIVLFVLNIVPMVLVICGNITIAVSIIIQRKKMAKVNPVSQHLANQGGNPKKIKTATKTLFFVSAMFIITSLPFTLGNVVMSLQRSRTPLEAARKQLIYTSLRHLMYCNFTFNFVLYFVSGTQFKREWHSLIGDAKNTIGRYLGLHNPATGHTQTHTVSNQNDTQLTDSQM